MFAPSKLPRLADAVEVDHRLGAARRQDLADLRRGPDVEAALLALGVGVEGRVEAALGAAHLAQHPVQRLLADAAVALVAERLPAVQVGAGEQGVVVEHLLEVGDEPVGVDRVAGEAAAELVVDAAGQHRVEGPLDDLASRRGRAAAPGPRRAGTSGRRRSRRARGRRAAAAAPPPPPAAAASGGSGSARSRRPRPSRARVAGGALADLLAFALEGVDDRFHHHPEARHAAALVRREVGAAVEGHAVGVEEDGHRPAAVAGHRLHRLHVDRVDVGALLAVDLDVDEVLVHVGGGLVVLEGLALHHVAPVAGRVADREQDRPVLLAGPLQRLGAPGVPVDRVVAVLEQVGAGLLGEAVGHRFQPTPQARRANYSARPDRRNSSPLAESQPVASTLPR